MGHEIFYVTSAIPYVNAEPHVGTAYEIIGCDLVARYHRLRGEDVYFLTGTDEHSLNVARSSADEGISPQEWVDRMVPKWLEVWRRLEISNDDFIRTSEPRHAERVQRFVQRLHDRGEVYLGTYTGPYCVSCEEFKQEKELVDGNCPIHLTPVEYLEEENYFFPLSKYQQPLLDLYEQRPEFVMPEVRRNEVVSFVAGGLQDLSVSRSGTDWGIPVPWDERHVIYVWVDALLNYITAPGFGTDDGFFEKVWPCDVHVIGKDITRFHAVIWPALLMAAGLEVPRTVFGHGFLFVGGEKMSKSRGTGVHPIDLLDHFGVDSYRYYFLREVPFGKDGNYSWESMVERHNADLANGLGNLASRVLAMLGSYFGSVVPEPSDPDAADDLPRVGGRRGPSSGRAHRAVRAHAGGGHDLGDRRASQPLPGREGTLEDQGRVETRRAARASSTRPPKPSASSPSSSSPSCRAPPASCGPNSASKKRSSNNACPKPRSGADWPPEREPRKAKASSPGWRRSREVQAGGSSRSGRL